MSTVQTGDTIAVYRSGKLYKAPADMSTLHNSDLIVVGRGNKSYQCTFADWKASQASISKPRLLTPADGATDLGETPTFTSSAFSGTGTTHASSDWQVTLKTDTAFASPVVQSMADTAHLLSWDGGPLQADTDYIARVRHNGPGGLQSPWSDVIGFKTADSFSDYVTAPGDLWVSARTKAGAFVTNPVKMTAVGWGDVGFAYGVDDKLYRTTDLSYANMAAVYTPTSPWVAFGRTYRTAAFAIDTNGAVYSFNSSTMAFSATAVALPGGAKAIAIGWPPNNSMGYVLGDDGVIYKANDQTAPTAFVSMRNTTLFKKFAVGAAAAAGAIYGIDASGALWVYTTTTGTESVSVALAGTATQLGAGSTFKDVHVGYNRTAYAIKSDGTLFRILDTYPAYPASGPAGVTIAELALSYYNIWVRSTDNRVFVAGATSEAGTGPFKPGSTPSPTAWAELDLPRPCLGFSTLKYSGSGYDYPLILP
jgi:hypothetical protein